MNKNLINVENVTYKYGDNTVLEDITFNVLKQDYIGIIGPNGSGKTTLVKLLLDIAKPASGTIQIDEAIKREKKISYVNQQVYSHYKNFPITAFEVVRMGLYAQKGALKFYSKEDNEHVEEILKQLDIEHLRNSQVTKLSGGERQRVLLGRSLISNPEVLILDEPTSALDPEFRESFYKMIQDINETGVTIIIVSHDLGVLETYVNKILYLDHKVEYFGSVENFRKSETFEGRHGDIV